MYKLALPPDQASYAADNGEGCLSARLDGGLSWYRKDVEGMAVIVDVAWTTGPEGYQYLQAFYRLHGHGATPFLVDLILDEPDLIEYTAHLLPKTFKTGSVQGQTYTVSAQFEILPPVSDAAYDDLVVSMNGGGIERSVSTALSYLTNYWGTGVTLSDQIPQDTYIEGGDLYE